MLGGKDTEMPDLRHRQMKPLKSSAAPTPLATNVLFWAALPGERAEYQAEIVPRPFPPRPPPRKFVRMRPVGISPLAFRLKKKQASR